MKHGALVSFPGLSLYCTSNPPLSTFHIPLHETLHEWFEVQAAVDNKDWATFWGDKVCESSGPCIIMSRANPHDRWEAGLLVQTKGWLSEKQIRWVNALCRVGVRLETDQEKLAKLSVDFMENPRQLFGSRVSDDQEWCIDRSDDQQWCSDKSDGDGV